MILYNILNGKWDEELEIRNIKKDQFIFEIKNIISEFLDELDNLENNEVYEKEPVDYEIFEDAGGELECQPGAEVNANNEEKRAVAQSDADLLQERQLCFRLDLSRSGRPPQNVRSRPPDTPVDGNDRNHCTG